MSFQGVRLGFIISCIAIGLGFMVPTVLTPFTHTNCRYDEGNRDLVSCDPIRPWLGYIQFALGTIVFFLAPFWLGLVFAIIWAVKRDWPFWWTFGQLMIASTVMLVSFILFEILMYRPWDSTPYNRFDLNSVYAGVFGLIVIFGAAFAFLVTIVFTKRLWQSFEPLGFRPQKKNKQV